TLVNMLLGRLKPQSGHVRMGQTDVAETGPDYVSQVATLMPQRVVLFDASIRANLLLGQRSNIEGYRFTREDLAILDDLGLGAICRLKALEMRPEKTEWALDESELLELRRLARERAEKLKVDLAPFEKDRVDPRRSVFDALVGGRTDGERALDPLLAGDKPAWLAAISISKLGEELRRRARVVLEESRNLLELPSFADFTSLSPDKLDERVWTLRRTCLRAIEASADAPLDRMRLARVGLTCAPSEWGADQSEADSLFDDLRQRFKPEIDSLRSEVEGAWEPFHAASIHTFLSWRDNLLFASADVANQRRRRKLDAMLMELMEGERWSTFFVTQGLEFEVGRKPTSALDPASRDRVADFLRRWCANRVVITISHDSEFTRRADEVHVVGAGRLVSRGSFSELSRTCETFRTVFRIE
ncbi:MAG: hypothetical protein JRF63_15805, partial [Deltaproteobacteria bacterium]|nr:hypothetical protein [Deltaproteobacteria bacterium]